MGNCRLIYKGAFNHPDIIGLTAEQNLFYIGLIVFADDEGRMEANPIFLKSLVLPYQEISSKTIIEALNALAAKNLITLYEVEEKQYLYHPKWLDWQHLRQNRIKQSNCPNPPLGGQMSALGGQMADKCQAKLSKVKLSKVKRDKGQKPSSTINYLKQIPKEDLEEFSNRYIITWAEIINKAQGLIDYCEMHGKVYKNYKAFLRNAISKDFQIREKRQGKSASELVEEAQKGEKS